MLQHIDPGVLSYRRNGSISTESAASRTSRYGREHRRLSEAVTAAILWLKVRAGWWLGNILWVVRRHGSVLAELNSECQDLFHQSMAQRSGLGCRRQWIGC
jgi:hypothetical protein